MAYKNIVFVKVEMQLLEDDRFLFDLNDRQKGLYLMMLALAGKTKNKIRDEKDFLKTRLALKELDMTDLEKISKVYPKFKCVNGYWQFANFDEIHNYVPSNSQAIPEEKLGSCKKKKEKEKEKESAGFPSNSDDEWISELKKDPTYSHINFDFEIGKSKRWLSTKPGRKFTRGFFINWINKIDRPMHLNGSTPKAPASNLGFDTDPKKRFAAPPPPEMKKLIERAVPGQVHK